jgi:glycosyltransferase involved in cell wall biosynthesis
LSARSVPLAAAARPSILMIGNFLSSSASIRFVCEDLAERFEREGWNVIAASSRAWRPGRLADMLATAWCRRREYAAAQIDVYSGPAFFWAESAAGLLKAIGKPHVLTLHGGNLPDFARRFPRRVRRLLSGADAVTSPSPYLARALSGFRPDIRVVPNPLDLCRYPFRPRARLRPRLVWLRAFHRIYRPEIAPAVLAAVLRRHPDAELTMIGPDKGDGSLEETRKAAVRAGVAARVTFAGPARKAEIPVRLARADVFVNTTDVDNTPVSLLEAMACGLCVVTTDAGGIPDLVADRRDAMVVPRGDPAALGNAVCEVLEDPALAAALSRRARARAEACDSDRVFALWRDVFSGAAGGAA